MHDFGSTVLACTPSYALFLAEAIQESGISRDEFKLRVGVFGAEPWTENMRREIEDKAKDQSNRYLRIERGYWSGCCKRMSLPGRIAYK